MVILLPKGNGESRGIGIYEVLWKVLSGVLKRRIGAVTNFQDVLHGLWAGWGTGNSSLETKLLHQLETMR